MSLLVGVSLILVTVIIHAVTITGVIAMAESLVPWFANRIPRAARSVVLSICACALALKHSIDISIWATAYWIMASEQFENFGDAFYFSSITYTTLGYGDIVIADRWRHLCGFEAINGMLLFGLSTALLFVFIERLWLGMGRPVGASEPKSSSHPG